MAYCYLKKYFAVLVVCTFILISHGYAAMQDTTATRPVPADGLRGTVIDEYGVPLNGVKITLKAKPGSASSDVAGKFIIQASLGDVLIFEQKNFYTREVKVGRLDSLTVRLSATYLRSPDRIDVLYNTADPKTNIGAVSTIYTPQLTTTPSTLYTYALPGQLPGLVTQQVSGFAVPQTGGQTTSAFIGNVVNHNNYAATDNHEFNLYLRGQVPITIIDNVQRDISSIDPESIESISVLKDALSNILLGNNSSRGTLLVTTKKPQIGKPRISFTAQTALQQPLGLPTPLPAYQYAYLYNEALQNDGKPALYSSADFNAYRNHTDPYGHPDVNWFKTILRDYSPMTSYRLNVNGGTEIARYTISLNYLDQAGMFKEAAESPYSTNNDLNRYMLNSDVSVNVTKKFNVDLQLFGRIQQMTQPGAGYAGILNALYTTPNNAYPVRNANGSFAGTSTFTNNLLSQTEYSGYQRTSSNDVLANLDLKYDLGSITPGLSLKGKGNLSFSSQSFLTRSLQNNTYLAHDSTYSPVGATVSQSNGFTAVSSARYSYAQGSLNYDRSFGKNNVSGTAFYDYRSAVLNYDLSQVSINRAIKGAYNYDGKYFAEAAVNSSGYNRYPPGHQFGLFYAGGLGWQMGRESFIKDNISWINSWKWRVDYGKTGNANVDNYGYYNFLQTYSNPVGYAYATGTSRGNVQSMVENGLANPYVTWEKAHKLDIGTDISLFNDHLAVTADYYHDKYYDLMQQRGASIALLGVATYPYENIGINLYKGWELSITYKNHANNFNYFITANGSVQSTKIIFNDEEHYPYPWLLKTGDPVDAIYGYKALGLFKTAQEAATSPTTAGYTPQAGDVKYADLNNDGVINQLDAEKIGNAKPHIYYGTTIGFNYKGFSFSAILQGVANRQILYDNNLITGFAGLGVFGPPFTGQGYAELNARWTPETAATATLPRLSLGNANNTAWSSLYVRSGNYFRLKNAEIGYELPYSIVHRMHISGLRIFANGENLLTLYGYKGVDPEVNGTTIYPVQRVFNAGVNLKL